MLITPILRHPSFLHLVSIPHRPRAINYKSDPLVSRSKTSRDAFRLSYSRASLLHRQMLNASLRGPVFLIFTASLFKSSALYFFHVVSHPSSRACHIFKTPVARACSPRFLMNFYATDAYNRHRDINRRWVKVKWRARLLRYDLMRSRTPRSLFETSSGYYSSREEEGEKCEPLNFDTIDSR